MISSQAVGEVRESVVLSSVRPEVQTVCAFQRESFSTSVGFIRSSASKFRYSSAENDRTLRVYYVSLHTCQILQRTSVVSFNPISIELVNS